MGIIIGHLGYMMNQLPSLTYVKLRFDRNTEPTCDEEACDFAWSQRDPYHIDDDPPVPLVNWNLPSLTQMHLHDIYFALPAITAPRLHTLKLRHFKDGAPTILDDDDGVIIKSMKQKYSLASVLRGCPAVTTLSWDFDSDYLRYVSLDDWTCIPLLKVYILSCHSDECLFVCLLVCGTRLVRVLKYSHCDCSRAPSNGMKWWRYRVIVITWSISMICVTRWTLRWITVYFYAHSWPTIHGTT